MPKAAPSRDASIQRQTDNSSFPLFLNILGYREDGEWVALTLEMDLRGYGESFQEAINDLRDLVLMQISFARFKSTPEMLLRPAEPIWFERFAQARQDAWAQLLNPTSRDNIEYLPAGLELPPAHVIAQLNSGFDPADAQAV